MHSLGSGSTFVLLKHSWMHHNSCILHLRYASCKYEKKTLNRKTISKWEKKILEFWAWKQGLNEYIYIFRKLALISSGDFIGHNIIRTIYSCLLQAANILRLRDNCSPNNTDK